MDGQGSGCRPETLNPVNPKGLLCELRVSTDLGNLLKKDYAVGMIGLLRGENVFPNSRSRNLSPILKSRDLSPILKSHAVGIGRLLPKFLHGF